MFLTREKDPEGGDPKFQIKTGTDVRGAGMQGKVSAMLTWLPCGAVEETKDLLSI